MSSLTNSSECILKKSTTFVDDIGESIRLYYDFTDWDIEWVYCLSDYGGEAKLSSSKSNMTASFLQHFFYPVYNKYLCPHECSHNTDPHHTPCTFKYINDGSCDIEYYVCDDMTVLGCKNGEGVMYCTNPRSNERCIAIIQSQQEGDIGCPDTGSDCFVDWSIQPVESSSGGFFDVNSCIQPVRDGSCHLPDSFKCEGVLWDVCANGIGQGKCTNDAEGCDIVTSSNCTVTTASNCGAITCDSCQASWNLPDKPALYDFPLGCMINSPPFLLITKIL